MNTENKLKKDEPQKETRDGFISMAKWPVINTAIILAFIWIVFSVLPADSGWRFGMRFKLLFSLFTVAGGFFFIFLKLGDMPEIRSKWKTFVSIAAIYLVTLSALVGLGFVLPRYEIPQAGEETAVNTPEERGEALFYDSVIGCYLCHSIGGSGGSRGPDLSGIGDIEPARRPDMSIEDFIRQSITDPAASIAPDFPPIMPANFGDRLTEQQLTDLVAFMKSLR